MNKQKVLRNLDQLLAWESSSKEDQDVVKALKVAITTRSLQRAWMWSMPKP